jgi:sulfur-oxidizing protein SoxB
MVRTGGLRYVCDLRAAMGSRIQHMYVNDRPVEAGKTYKVAGWAPVAEEARAAGGAPIWEIVELYLRSRKTVKPLRPNVPRLV